MIQLPVLLWLLFFSFGHWNLVIVFFFGQWELVIGHQVLHGLS